MSLIGEYRFECDNGLLIIHPNLGHVRCFLRNSSGTVLLCPRYEPENGQYLLPFGYSKSMDSIRSIVDSLAAGILQTVSCFSENKASLLKICFNVGKPAVELMEDCPAIISLIAGGLDANLPIHAYLEQAKYLVRQKRKKILSYFSYPSSKSAIKLMRKIPAPDSGLRCLESFRGILDEGNPGKIKILQHAEHINWLVLHLLAGGYFALRVRASFILEAGKLTDPEEMYAVNRQISEMDRIISAADGELTVPVLTNLKSLETVHDRLAAEYREVKKYKEIITLEFPEPPLPGIKIANEENGRYGIFPLQNGIDLLCEGREMEHCIATYAHRIVEENGWLYAYHVHLPNKPPATILIRNNPCLDKSQIEQISGCHNSPVDPAVELYVHNWLSQHGTKKSGRDKGYTEEPHL